MGFVDSIKKIFRGRRDKVATVQETLTCLPAEYLVFNGILYNDSEIHHVVFSRNKGLFVINTASGKGEVTYNGSRLLVKGKPRSEVVKKILQDIFWLKSTIREQIGVDVYITPIVVFENAKVSVNGPIIGVRVMEPVSLVDAVAHAPERNALEDGVVMVLRELHGVQVIRYRG
jgi:hypothetical protein